MAKAKQTKKQKQKQTNTLVISGALGVLVISVLVALYATGVLFSGLGSGDQKGFQNVTFTDAVVSCHDQTKDRYGESIRNVVTDDHSSRYDKRSFLYKIFLKVDVYNKSRTNADMYYVNCFVRASNGKIRKYEALKEGGSFGKKADKSTNMFGMPKNR